MCGDGGGRLPARQRDGRGLVRTGVRALRSCPGDGYGNPCLVRLDGRQTGRSCADSRGLHRPARVRARPHLPARRAEQPRLPCAGPATPRVPRQPGRVHRVHRTQLCPACAARCDARAEGLGTRCVAFRGGRARGRVHARRLASLEHRPAAAHAMATALACAVGVTPCSAQVEHDAGSHEIQGVAVIAGHHAHALVDGQRLDYRFAWSGGTLWLHTPCGDYAFDNLRRAPAPAARSAAAMAAEVRATINGRVVDVPAQPGVSPRRSARRARGDEDGT
jgi:uncharacterized membrane protein